MRRTVQGFAIIISGAALILAGLLLALTISSPSGNVGDEGIIAIPLILILVATIPIGFITALIYIFKEQPRGNLLILPLFVMLIPVIMIVGIYGYGNFKKNQGVISADEATALVKQCKVKSMTGDNHKRFKLNFSSQQSEKVWISADDRLKVQTEIVNSKSYCNNQ